MEEFHKVSSCLEEFIVPRVAVKNVYPEVNS